MATTFVGQHTHDVDQLVAAACDRADLDDFGADGWREGLERLVTSVETAPNVSDGGRGYYRPISLLSVWAFAPFMHNNAIGPEVCGAPRDRATDLYRSPYVVRGTWQLMANPPRCWPYRC